MGKPESDAPDTPAAAPGAGLSQALEAAHGGARG